MSVARILPILHVRGNRLYRNILIRKSSMFLSSFIEICTNCGKTFYQPLDKCCYCGSSFDLASYHRNWRKWYNSTRSNDFNFVKYSDFSKPTRELACAVIETADFDSLKKIVLAGYDGWDSYDIISAAQDLPFPEIIAFLMERGINFRNLDGSVFTSNLAEAIRYDFVEYARWFIEKGADFNYRESQGNGYFLPSPAQYARSDEMAELLINYGATADIYQTVHNQKIWHDRLIERVEHLRGYILSVTFRNGKQQVINIEPYIRRYPEIFQEMIDDPQIVSQVKFNAIEVFWNELMSIEAMTLYRIGLYNE